MRVEIYVRPGLMQNPAYVTFASLGLRDRVSWNMAPDGGMAVWHGDGGIIFISKDGLVVDEVVPQESGSRLETR